MGGVRYQRVGGRSINGEIENSYGRGGENGGIEA